MESLPILRGTWGEILAHRDEISTSERVAVISDPLLVMDDDEEQKRLQEVFDDLFQEADGMEFTPPEGPLPPATEAIVDKFRRKGLRT